MFYSSNLIYDLWIDLATISSADRIFYTENAGTYLFPREDSDSGPVDGKQLTAIRQCDLRCVPSIWVIFKVGNSQ